jgi:outer membrane immunogenic protein
MQARTGRFTSFVCVIVVSIAAHSAHGQSAAAAKDGSHPELALAYNYVHSNTPAGDCGCFSLNGGSATFAWPLRHAGLSLVGDVSVTHAGSISSSGLDLTLGTYTAGARYSLPGGHLRPFGQVLVGVAHSSGSLVEGSDASTASSGAAFASLMGGGVDLHATHHFSIRLVEADYLLTTFYNGSNNHQNNLRISTGVVLRF